jgi:hypothetical protein
MRIALIAFLGLMAPFLSRASAAADPPPVVVIVDTTAQMNANFGQRRKIDLLKTAIPAVIRRLEPNSPVALWAFGTNPAKKCEDASELVSLQPASSAARAIEGKLSPLQPKAGRAPAFAALRSALKSLGNAEGQAQSAVLVAGTGDDCSANICASARELKGLYPNAKLDVIGIGMSQTAVDAYTCAAKAMGGSFTAAKNSGDLDRVLRQVLNATEDKGSLEKAPSNAAGTAAMAVQPEKQPEAPDSAKDSAQDNSSAAAQPAQPEPNAVLSAALAAGVPVLEAGVTWRITKIVTTPTGQQRLADMPSWTGGGGQAKVTLPDGHYWVEASYGLAKAQFELVLAGAKAERLLLFDAGTIAAQPSQATQAEQAGGVFFTLYRDAPGGAREELARSSTAPALFYVNAGKYILKASAGLAKIETPVTVLPGKVSVVNASLNLGTLEIKTFAAEGKSEPIPAWHRLYREDAGPSALPLLTLSGAPERVQLPAGRYRLETSYGQTRQETNITITADQTTAQTVTLNAGEAKIDLASGQDDSICAIYEAGSSHDGEPVGRASGDGLSFIVKAGVYDVECRKKGASGAAKQAQIRVVAGETLVTKIEQ